MKLIKNKNRERFEQHNFLGIGIEAVTYDDLYALVDGWIEDKARRSHHIAVINTYCIMSALTNDRLKGIYSKADLISPDGRPFVYWMRLFMRRKVDQFDASSVLIKLAEKAEEKNYTFYLYGGHPDVVRRMKENLERDYPYIKILGHKSPPFKALTENEDQRICEEINRLKPDIICVGLGTPKQDYWIDAHIEKIRGAVFVPSGAIFDFFGGRVKRAPKWISKMGLEWLYRLFSKDFKRLWYRYTVLNLLFLWYFLLQNFRIKNFPVRRDIRT
ncbi:MAG: WecB/TagA/CpsF family glycosyltransferase [Candidatus Omnitrophica bacterium]|nr:WecB/TagA/CpsF family glycosyltransferase [Candidatus Omnitrophota bacterium]